MRSLGPTAASRPVTVPVPGAPRPAAAAGSPAALLALGLAGLCAFLNLYASQPLLPLLSRTFAVSEGVAAWTVSAPPIAVALAAPFAGSLANRLGRRRVIVGSLFALLVPTVLAATAGGIPSLVAWRFAQGLVVPGIYVVAMTYIGEAWSGPGLGRAMAALITGNVLGGFSGRFLAGLAAEWHGWRASFLVLAGLTAIGAAVTARWLPAEPRTARGGGSPLADGLALLRRLDRPLAATYAVAFALLFTQMATFTYVTFRLAGPPFHLGTGALSSLFVVYLVGAVVTPVAGRGIDRFGPRATLVASFAAGIAGGLLTLVPSLPVVVAGLAVFCSATFVGQAAATSFLQMAAPPEVRAAASGLYVSVYYVGGSAGGVVPALAWRTAGWPGCVALVAAVQLATLLLARRCWVTARPRTTAPSPPALA